MSSPSEYVGTTAGEMPELTELLLGSCPRVALSKNNALTILRGSSTASAMEAYKSLRARLMSVQTSRGFRSVAITSAAQSDGKTLTALNLAGTCAQLENTSVLLIDADLRKRGLTRLIGQVRVPGLTDALNATVSYKDAVARTDVGNLYVMGAGTSDSNPAELFSGDGWKRLINWASNTFKLVLVDSLPMGSVADSDLIAAKCDGVLFIVRAKSTPRETLVSALELIEPGKLIGVVWNGMDPNNSSRKAYSVDPQSFAPTR